MTQVGRYIFYVLFALLPIALFAQETGIEFNLLFDVNSSNLTSIARKSLDSLVKTKSINKKQFLLIYGYADSIGNNKQCEQISKARAKAVKKYLISKGLSEYNFLLCIGLGKIDSLRQNIDAKKYYNKVELLTENIKNINITTAPLKKCSLDSVTLLPETPTSNPENADKKYQSTFDAKTISINLNNGDEFFGTLNKKRLKIDYGVYVWANGEKYAGEFKNDKKEGHGTYKWKNGAVFEGEWKNDQPVSGKLQENLEGKYLLKILADKNCKISINGTDKGEINAGEVGRFFLPIGTFKLKIVNKNDSNDVFETYYIVRHYGKEDLITIALGAKTDSNAAKSVLQASDDTKETPTAELKSEQKTKKSNTKNTPPKPKNDIDKNDNMKQGGQHLADSLQNNKQKQNKKKTSKETTQLIKSTQAINTFDNNIVSIKSIELTPTTIYSTLPEIGNLSNTNEVAVINKKYKHTSTKKKHLPKFDKTTKTKSGGDTLKNENFAPIKKDEETETGEDNNDDYIVTSPFQIYDTSNNMLYVPGGDYEMGSDTGSIATRPKHTVTISSFYICKYEVTVAEFRTFVKATGYRTSAEQEARSWIFKYKKEEGLNEKYLKQQKNVTWEYDENGIKRTPDQDNQPVLHISWVDAYTYCEWYKKITGKKYRLPTEAEWEFVAKGGGYKDKNQLLLSMENMLSEVWEWCADWYEPMYYSQSPRINPTGPAIGTMRVLRGGKWAKCTGNSQITCRYYNYPEVSGCYIGLRIAKSN